MILTRCGISYKGHGGVMVTTGAATQLKNLHRLWPGGAGDIRQHGEPAAADLSLRALQPWWRSSSPSSLSCRATTRS